MYACHSCLRGEDSLGEVVNRGLLASCSICRRPDDVLHSITQETYQLLLDRKNAASAGSKVGP